MFKQLLSAAGVALFLALVDAQESDSTQCGPNEVWEDCPEPCPPQVCRAIYTRYDCTEINANYTCKGECRCKSGYYRNAIGECITTEECLKCTGANEYFSCGGACDNVCDTLKEQNQTNCPIINIVCNPMCYCLDGYARNDNNECVPYNECPVKCPGANEYYEVCSPTCPPQTCASLSPNATYNCPEDDGSCKPACRCTTGNYRNDNGVCISEQQCTSCGGDRNAKPGCGINCGRLCSNYMSKKPAICPRICKLNGCDCKSDYVFDSNTNKCVLPRDCTMN